MKRGRKDGERTGKVARREVEDKRDGLRDSERDEVNRSSGR